MKDNWIEEDPKRLYRELVYWVSGIPLGWVRETSSFGSAGSGHYSNAADKALKPVRWDVRLGDYAVTYSSQQWDFPTLDEAKAAFEKAALARGRAIVASLVKKQLIFEGGIFPDEIDREDGDKALTAQIDGDNVDPHMFVRLQSWDETTEHPTMDSLMGKKVRVTVEVIE